MPRRHSATKDRRGISNYGRTGPLPNTPEGYSIDPLQRRRLALLDARAALVAAIAEQLVRQALIALLAGIGRFAAAQPALGGAKPGGGLLAGLARPGGVDRLARPLGGADLLRPRGAELRRAQLEIGRDRQRRARLDGELVRPRPIEPDHLPDTGA